MALKDRLEARRRPEAGDPPSADATLTVIAGAGGETKATAVPPKEDVVQKSAGPNNTLAMAKAAIHALLVERHADEIDITDRAGVRARIVSLADEHVKTAGIAINRLTGGVSGNAKFDLEVVTEGTTFTTDIHLRNFEIWQLGMLFIIIQDMEDELIRIGSGRSRGLGKVKASISEQDEGSHKGGVLLSTTRTGNNGEKDDDLWGLGSWLGEEATIYGTRRDDMLRLSLPVVHKPNGIRNTRIFKGEALNKLKGQSIEAFVTRIQEWTSASETTSGASQRS